LPFQRIEVIEGTVATEIKHTRLRFKVHMRPYETVFIKPDTLKNRLPQRRVFLI